jgi:transposase-like protein
MTTGKNRAENARQRLVMIEKFIESGQSAKQFCQQEDVNYGTFQYWLKKYREQRSAPACEPQTASSFVPLTFSSTSTSRYHQRYTIEYHDGVVLHINQDIPLSLLIQLIRAQEN